MQHLQSISRNLHFDGFRHIKPALSTRFLAELAGWQWIVSQRVWCRRWRHRQARRLNAAAAWHKFVVLSSVAPFCDGV